MPKLTQAYVLRLRPSEREAFHWDTQLPGFGLRAKPSGVRTFVVQYRNAGGRTRRYAIAKYGVMTVEEARKEARQLLSAVAKGADPSAERASGRTAPTVADLIDRYMREHSEAHKKASSVKEDRRLLNRNVKPRLGTTKAASVTRGDIAKLHHALRKTPYEANRTLAILSKMFNLSEVWGLRPDGSNPCRHVKRFREAKRERFFSGDELKRIGEALATAERDGTEMPGITLAVRLLALTGCRMGEILALRWEDVELKKGLIRLTDAKAGARDVMLGTPARALLADSPKDDNWVVHGPNPDKPLSRWTLEKAWRRIRDNAKLENARLHDFRHTVGTYGGHAGFNAFIVRDLLGHKTLAMTGRYVERDTDPVRAAADLVSERVAAAMAGNSAKVIPMVKVDKAHDWKNARALES
ncbi:MAG: site-specific integrase [Hyphomicrobiales bacterium]|nr:site-specific integrase [Hyphomicrobiales bacterium]